MLCKVPLQIIAIPNCFLTHIFNSGTEKGFFFTPCFLQLDKINIIVNIIIIIGEGCPEWE